VVQPNEVIYARILLDTRALVSELTIKEIEAGAGSPTPAFCLETRRAESRSRKL